MKSLLAIALPLSLLAGCRSHSDSKDPAPIVVPFIQPTPTSSPVMDLVTSATAEGCLKLASGSLKYEYRFLNKGYQIQASVHGDETCQNKATTEIYQSGDFTEKELADASGNVLTLQPNEATVRWNSEVPESFKSCTTDGEMLGKTVKIGHMKDCQIKLEVTSAYRSKPTDAIPVMSSFAVDLAFLKQLGINLSNSSIKTSLNTLSALSGLMKAEESLCYPLFSHKMSEGVCTPIEFASASADSLIEFEKGTGLYPKLKKQTVELLPITESSIPLTVSYKFPCLVSLDGNPIHPEAFTFIQIRSYGSGSDTAVILAPQANDQAVVKNIGGKGPILLQQFNKYLSLGTIALSAYRVDTNCNLTAQVSP